MKGLKLQQHHLASLYAGIHEMEIQLTLVNESNSHSIPQRKSNLHLFVYFAHWTWAASTSELVLRLARDGAQKPACPFEYCCASFVRIVCGGHCRIMNPQNRPLGASSTGWRVLVITSQLIVPS